MTSQKKWITRNTFYFFVLSQYLLVHLNGSEENCHSHYIDLDLPKSIIDDNHIEKGND